LPWSLTESFDDYDRALYERVFLVWTDAYQSAAVSELATMTGVESVFSEGGVQVAAGSVGHDGRPAILLDGYRDLHSATVFRANVIEPADQVENEFFDEASTVCSSWLDESQWHCGRRDDFVHVAQVSREMDDQVRNCIYANPPGGQTRWRIEWPAVDGATQLRLRAGNTLWAQRHHRGSAVHIRALVNEVEVTSMTFEPDASGYPESVVDLAETGSSAALRVEIWADDPLDRFFCFRPQLLGAPAL
jgi:hypothetical protein